MDDKGSVGKISVSSDSVSTLNSEDFVLVSRLGDETPSSTNNGSDDEKTGLKVRTVGLRKGWKNEGGQGNFSLSFRAQTKVLKEQNVEGRWIKAVVSTLMFVLGLAFAACKTSLPSWFPPHVFVFLY